MRTIMLLAAGLGCVAGCAAGHHAGHHRPTSVTPVAPVETEAATRPLPAATEPAGETVVVESAGGGGFAWFGWSANVDDVPTLIRDHPVRSILIRPKPNYNVDYKDVSFLRDAFKAAGVPDVRISMDEKRGD